jgi:hypothetical protein
MRTNRLQEIIGTAVVQEEPALTNAPQGGGAKHVTGGKALGDVVSEAFAHVMNEQVGERVGS